jgi:hypothetical protein
LGTRARCVARFTLSGRTKSPVRGTLLSRHRGYPNLGSRANRVSSVHLRWHSTREGAPMTSFSPVHHHAAQVAAPNVTTSAADALKGGSRGQRSVGCQRRSCRDPSTQRAGIEQTADAGQGPGRLETRPAQRWLGQVTRQSPNCDRGWSRSRTAGRKPAIRQRSYWVLGPMHGELDCAQAETGVSAGQPRRAEDSSEGP